MFKLILFVYILGQDAGKQRMYLLMGLAVVIYMWKMGYLRFVRRAVEAALPDPRTLIDRLFPAGGGADPQAANVAQPTERRDGENQPPQQQENGRGQHRLGRIAVFLSFIYSFVYGFICSLLPAWNPEPHARLDELMPQPDANQNGDQDATQGDGQRQPNEIGHEHAD